VLEQQIMKYIPQPQRGGEELLKWDSHFWLSADPKDKQRRNRSSLFAANFQLSTVNFLPKTSTAM
jgi:hypothetical protein